MDEVVKQLFVNAPMVALMAVMLKVVYSDLKSERQVGREEQAKLRDQIASLNEKIDQLNMEIGRLNALLIAARPGI